MLSKKCQKYISSYQERNYAPKSRKVEKGDLAKHSDRSSSWKTPETSSCNSIQQSGKVEEEVVELSGKTGQLEDVQTNQTKGEEMKQGNNARLDESLGAKDKDRKMTQTLKSRRKESEGMEKAAGKKKFSGDKKMK